MDKLKIVPYPIDGMIYYCETTEDSTDAWVGNRPIQYVDQEGYHCGWGLATLCFKFDDLDTLYFLTREEAEAHLRNEECWI